MPRRAGAHITGEPGAGIHRLGQEGQFQDGVLSEGARPALGVVRIQDLHLVRVELLNLRVQGGELSALERAFGTARQLGGHGLSPPLPSVSMG